MKFLALLPLLFSFSSNANATRILYFGDSHSVATAGPFGIRMNQLLRELPEAEVETHARCGSTMGWWYSGKSTTCGYFDQNSAGKPLPPKPARGEKWLANAPTPKIIPLIEKIKPELIVIEMGGNYTHAFHPALAIKEEVGKFIADLQIQKSKSKLDCVWIGLPSRRLPKEPQAAKKFEATILTVRDTIKSIVEPTCEFVDSLPMTAYPAVGGDGIHYSLKFKDANGDPIAFKWAEKSFETVKAHYEKIRK